MIEARATLISLHQPVDRRVESRERETHDHSGTFSRTSVKSSRTFRTINRKWSGGDAGPSISGLSGFRWRRSVADNHADNHEATATFRESKACIPV